MIQKLTKGVQVLALLPFLFFFVLHKPCSHTDDLGARLGVLFNVHGPVGLPLPDGRLIISVNDIEFNINIGVERGAAAVRGANAEPELLFLHEGSSLVGGEKEREHRGSKTPKGLSKVEGELEEKKSNINCFRGRIQTEEAGVSVLEVHVLGMMVGGGAIEITLDKK